jgi:serine/threonine-protein kinase HipA
MATAYKEIEVRFSKIPEEFFAMGMLAENNHNLYFEYDSEWLSRNLELSPFVLPSQTGLIKHQNIRCGPLFRVFDDCLPDRQMRLLLVDRHFAARTLNPPQSRCWIVSCASVKILWKPSLF